MVLFLILVVDSLTNVLGSFQTTLTGRTIVKHMSAEVNKVITGKYDPCWRSNDLWRYRPVTLADIVLKEQIDAGKLSWDKDNVIKLYDLACEAANETFRVLLEAFQENQVISWCYCGG